VGKGEKIFAVLVEDKLRDFYEQSEQDRPITAEYANCNCKQIESKVLLKPPFLEQIAHLKACWQFHHASGPWLVSSQCFPQFPDGHWFGVGYVFTLTHNTFKLQ
jgi:hypothetical protein